MKIISSILEPTEGYWGEVVYPGTGMTEETLMSLPSALESNLQDAESKLSNLESNLNSFYTVGISELEQISNEVPSITNSLKNISAFYRQSPSEVQMDTFNSKSTIETITLNQDLNRGYVTRPILGYIEAQTKIVNLRLGHGSIGVPGNNSEISSIQDVVASYNAASPSVNSLDGTLASLTIDEAASRTPSVFTVADTNNDNHASVFNAFDGDPETVFEWERVQVEPNQKLGFAGYSRVFSAGMNTSDIYATCSTGGWSGYVAWPDTQFNWGNGTTTAISSGQSVTVYKPTEPMVRLIEEQGVADGDTLPSYTMELELQESVSAINMDIDFLIRYIAVKLNEVSVSNDGISWRTVLKDEVVTAANNPLNIVIGFEDTLFKYIRIDIKSLGWYVPPKGIAHPYVTYVQHTRIDKTGGWGLWGYKGSDSDEAKRGDVTPFVVGTCPVTLNGTKYILGRVATALTATSGAFSVGGGVGGLLNTVMGLGAAAIAAAQTNITLALGSSMVKAVNSLLGKVGAGIGKNIFSLPGNVVGWVILGLDFLTGGKIGEFLMAGIYEEHHKVTLKGQLSGYDILYGRRSGIAIRNVLLSNPNYSGSGELVTKPYLFSKGYSRFVFDATETSKEIKYYLRIGYEATIDSAPWVEVVPAYRGDPTSSIASVEGDRVQVKIVMGDSGSPIVKAIFVEGSN